MDIEITKYKNYSSSDSLNNRLTRLERILQQILEISGNNAKNPNGSLIAGGIVNNDVNLPGKLLAELASMVPDMSAPAASTRQPEFSITPRQNIAKNVIRSLLLSNGQIISELAAAIARAGQRNS